MKFVNQTIHKNENVHRLWASVQIAALVALAEGRLSSDARLTLKNWVAGHSDSEAGCRTLFTSIEQLPERTQRVDAHQFDLQVEKLAVFLRTRRAREQAYQLAFQACEAKGGITRGETMALLRLVPQLGISSAFARTLAFRANKKWHDRLGKFFGFQRPAAPVQRLSDKTIEDGGLTLVSTIIEPERFG